jgi:hypothetical protein
MALYKSPGPLAQAYVMRASLPQEDYFEPHNDTRLGIFVGRV